VRLAIDPAPSDEEAAAIVAALTHCHPEPSRGAVPHFETGNKWRKGWRRFDSGPLRGPTLRVTTWKRRG